MQYRYTKTERRSEKWKFPQNACQLSKIPNIKYQGRKKKRQKKTGLLEGRNLEDKQREGKEGRTEELTGEQKKREKGKRRMRERDGGKEGRERGEGKEGKRTT